MLPVSPHSRIAVMGAGCAGLTCAEELRELGFYNLTVFEAQRRAGGKIRSIPYAHAPIDGRGLFEAGTVFFVPSPMWSKLLRRYGVSDAQAQMGRIRVADVRRGAATIPIRFGGGHSIADRLRQVARLMMLVHTHGRAHEARPGIAPHVTPELCVTARQWFAQQGLPYVRDVLLPIVGAAQFGPLADRVPAVYVMRLIALLRRFPLLQHLRNAMPQLRAGHEALWTRMAASHDVRLGEPVQRIDTVGGIAIHTRAGREEFDALIVAAPTAAYQAAATDLDDDQRELFEQVRSIDREVITARVDGLPPDLFYAPRYAADGAIPPAHPHLFYEVDRRSGLYTFHPYLDDGASAADTERAIRAVVEPFGGRVRHIEHRVVVRGWFPHFSEPALRAGAYARLESMQGRRNVWFAGELLAGIGVPHGMEYAAALVRRMTGVAHA